MSPHTPTPPGGTRPPPSDPSTPHGVLLKGIAGSPGVAVGPALVVGDTKAAYARRHISTAQIDGEIARLHQAVEEARRHVREVSARLPAAPLETNAILDAYLAMVGDPMLLERVERKIRGEKKCAEWAVAQGCDEIAKMFGPTDATGRDAYIVERRHDIEFVCDRLLRELTGDTKQIVPRLDQPMVVIARDLSRPTPQAWSANRSSRSSPRSVPAPVTRRSWRARWRSRRSSARARRYRSFAPATQ